MQNWRQGTVACKDRDEVAFALTKSHGSKRVLVERVQDHLRSPLWRGGGVTFGPQPRVRTLKVSKSLKETCALAPYSIDRSVKEKLLAWISIKHRYAQNIISLQCI